MTRGIFLEDLQPGQRFTAGPVGVSVADIKRYAAEFDPQPFHLEEAAAEAHPIFRGLAASGWHTAALTMRLIVQAYGAFGWGALGAGGEIAWPRPVRPGDRLRLVAEVLEVKPSRSRPDRGIVPIRNITLNQHDEEVQLFTGRVVVPRRPA